MNRWLSILTLLALLLNACGTSTPAATSTPREPTPESTVAPPTEMLLPTATPMPLPPPRLLSHGPSGSREQPLDAPVELAFDQPMDRTSVEAAFTISPTVEGSFAWANDRTLNFVPPPPSAESTGGGLARGLHYQVTVSDTARNAEGMPLAEPVAFEFDTVGRLTVSQVLPSPGSVDLDPDTTVTVVFDHPVVPLTAISRQAELPRPLTFMPPVRGQGEWLNTSIYLFRPEAGLLPATRYKARVAAGLVNTTGGVLDEDYTWEFATIQPAVLEVRPWSQFRYVGPTDVISVTFNQPMDHASAQSHFALEVGDQTVDGTFRWRGGETSTAPETLVFVPSRPLPRNTNCVARVNAGAKARVGNMGTTKDKVWRFSTVKEPGFVTTSPQDGDENVAPEGSVRITFTSPMQRQGFLDHLTIRPQVTNVYTYWSEYDTEVRIYFQRDPVTAYSLSLDGDTPDKYGATLGKAAQVRFTTTDLKPYAALNTGGRLGTFSAYTDTIIYGTYRNVSRLDVSLYRLSPRTFMRLNSDWQSWDRFAPDEADLVHHWTQQVRAPRNQVHLTRFSLTDAEGDLLHPGLYYLEMSAPEVRADVRDYRPSRYMFVKSQLNLSLKQTRAEALVWATDLANGQPVAGLPVAFYDQTNELDATGVTSADGIYVAKDLAIKNLWDAFYAITGEPGDDGFGLAFNAWDNGISPWSFDVESEFWGSDYQGYLYTDRPMYRPGQTVHFKGIVRADDDARYSLPKEIDTVRVHISDPQGRDLSDVELPLNDMGTLHDKFVLDDMAPLGTYYIEGMNVTGDLLASTTFRVAEYRKPEFQVSVTTDRDAYLGGDTVKVTAEAIYYFGGPVTGADVHWSALSSDHGFQYRCPQGQSCPSHSWTDFEWGDETQDSFYGSYGHLLAEGDTRTDDQGRVTFKVPAEIAGETQSQRFTIEVSVTDLNGQQVSNRVTTIVHKGTFYIGVAPRGYLAKVGEDKQVELLTVDWEGEPVAGVPLTVVFSEHHWYSVREQAEDGAFYWTWTAEDSPVLTTTISTDDDGQAIAPFTPEKAGSYRVRATGRDSHGNELRSSAYFWVWGGEAYVSWRRESNNRIELVADKEEYQVGDIAEILIPTPYTGTVQALVTVERGHIMETEVRTLQSNTEILRLPITAEHAPNVFLSVILVQGSEKARDGLATFKMGVVKLPVSIAAKQLKITLTPDKDMEQGLAYGPRETATYDVVVTDQEGDPVEAELSFRLADLAVLALAEEPGPTLLDRFWRSRGLGVKTSTTLVVAMEPFNREILPEAKGGGGGEAGGLIRSRFADTAFWDPVVRTGKNGRAQVTLQLPDNLTTWRMQARGLTAATQVGRGEVDVLSTQDLLVRPVLPRFFVAGDEAQIATIVHNNRPEALEVEVNISTEGLVIEGSTSQTVNVPARDRAKVIWPVKALPAREVKVRMWARSSGASASGTQSTSGQALYDGREDRLPVYRYATPEVVATGGQLSEPGLRQEIIQLPSVLDPSQGELTVQLDGSLTAATQDALNYLEHYPYECVEQTISRFLPNVVTWAVLDAADLEQPALRQKLAQTVGIGLQRIYAQQHYDGGWGWWVSDRSDPYLTGYVLQGMLEAHRAGFVVDKEVMAKAASYLHDELPSVSATNTHWEANRLAYQLYILADYQATFDERAAGELGLAIRLFEKRHLLSNYARATLALALSLLEPEESERVGTLLGDLASDAVVSATGTHWDEEKPDRRNMNTDIRTTATVLWALSRLEPGSEFLPTTVRWLMAARKEGYWETTQSTAWSLLGLAAYMRVSGELEGDFSYTVYLNGEDLGSDEVSRVNIDQSHELQIEISRLLVDEGNRLVIERHAAQAGQTGEGQLYYTAHLRHYLPAEHVQALDQGIIIARQYSLADNHDISRAAGEYVDHAQVGDVIRVKLTLIAPTDLHYVVVEAPLPAGFEGIDLSLKTTSVVGEQPELRKLSAEEEDRWYRWYGWGWWWFSHSEMRDEKVVLFAQNLPRGTYEYTYLMRAGVPGEFLTMPATAYEMYFPEVFGRSDGGKFTVESAN